nr:hypothetical protein [Candidatus Anammoximicrobium sp.]
SLCSSFNCIVAGDAPATMQLYDLQSDPAEQRNVAAEHPDQVQRLKAIFDAMNEHVPLVEEVKRAPIRK